MNHESDNELLKRTIKNQLDEQANQLPDNINRKLNTIRHKAVFQDQGHEEDFTLWYERPYIPVIATCLSVIGIMIVILRTPDVYYFDTPPAGNNVDEIELVLSNEDFDLMEQELEFYAWMAEDSTG